MKARMRIALFAGCLIALGLVPARASALSLEPVGPSFVQPVYVTAPPGDPRLFVVERAGQIQVLHDGGESEFLDIESRVDSTNGERGMLSMAFDPNYAANGLFYVFYAGNATAGAAGDIHIDEFHVSADPNAANPLSRRTVWTFSHGAVFHNGGQLQFGPDGLLYISVGDNTVAENAQSLDNPYGKILRIDPHGSGNGVHGIPQGNPFAGSGTPEIWSLGLRNPFRFSFDELTGDLIVGDVGENTFEEIDLAPASSGGGRAVNFGWPACEGFNQRGSETVPCGAGGVTAPVFAYPHGDDPGGDVAHGCAIIGGFVYRGSQAPEIAGRYLYADLCTSELRSIQLGLPLASDDRAESAPGALISARSFGEDSTCNLYVTNTDTVFRIVGSQPGTTPACAMPPPAPPTANTTTTKKKQKKCKKRHHKKKHRAADAKKKHKKKCKKRKKKRGRH